MIVRIVIIYIVRMLHIYTRYILYITHTLNTDNSYVVFTVIVHASYSVLLEPLKVALLI